MKKTKILALFLSCAMLVTLFTGCGGGESYGKVDGKTLDSDLYNMVATAVMYQNFYGVSDKQTIRDALAETSEDGTTLESQIKDECLYQVKRFFAVENLAKEHNIELTDADRATIEENKNADIEQAGGRAKFVESLKQSNMTEEVYDYINENNTLANKLYTAVYSEGGVHAVAEDEIISDMTGNCIRVVHILIQAQQNSTDFAEKKAKAEATLARVNAGEDFTALIKEVNEDPGMTSQPDGYVFDKQGYTMDTSGSQMVTEFTEASWALQVGQNSGLVQTSYGFHIIKRLPLDDAYIRENMDTYYPYYANMSFSWELAQTIETLPAETNEAYDKIDMVSFFPEVSTSTTPAQ